ncbi:MAG: hypothetical protein Q9198_010403 [Flavoplaca austrocitrina]
MCLQKQCTPTGLALTNAKEVLDILAQVQVEGGAGGTGLEVVLRKWLENLVHFSGHDAIRQNGQYSTGTLDLDRINRQLFPFLKVAFLPQIEHTHLDGKIEVFEDEDARQDAEPAPCGARLKSTQRRREAQESEHEESHSIQSRAPIALERRVAHDRARRLPLKSKKFLHDRTNKVDKTKEIKRQEVVANGGWIKQATQQELAVQITRKPGLQAVAKKMRKPEQQAPVKETRKHSGHLAGPKNHEWTSKANEA